MIVVDDDHISRGQFPAAACFHFAIHGDISFLDRNLGLTAAADNSRGLQELVKGYWFWFCAIH